MDDKQNWEWLEKIEDRIKAIPSSEKVLKDYTFTFGIPLIGSPSLIDIQEKAYLNEDHKGLIQLIQCVRTLREALELIAENEQWSKNGPNRACGIGCDGIKGDDGIYSPQNGHEDRCLIYGAKAALEKAAKGEFE